MSKRKKPTEGLEGSNTFFTDSSGRKWAFRKSTPKAFRFNGLVKTQEEWLEDEDSMKMLVFGNSSYMEKIK